MVNPGKRFYKLAANAVKEVNGTRDSNEISYARKAMVMTGISLGYDGVWSEAPDTEPAGRCF